MTLHFDINLAQLRAIGDELQASEKQIKLALSAALRRTATTLRTLSARGLASELELRTIGLLRKRLKTLKLRMSGNGEGVQLWYGLNEMPVSWFKGKPKQDYRGAWKRDFYFAGAFVAKSKFKGRDTILKRTGKRRLHIEEETIMVEDRAIVFVEDKIFDQTEEILWKNFRRELTARVKYSIGDR